MNRSTRRTVLVAGLANIAIAVIKLITGIAVGSAAMLAEAAHSVADTLNQGFLLTSLHRSDRPADAAHPFGYGKERYFWSLLAAVGIFVADAGFSIFGGILAITHGGSDTSPTLAYVVLAVAFAADISADQAEDMADELDRRLRDRLPVIRHVFLDPTQRRRGVSRQARRHRLAAGL